MAIAASLLDFLCPMSRAAGVVSGPLICVHVYSYWTCEEVVDYADRSDGLQPNPDRPPFNGSAELSSF